MNEFIKALNDKRWELRVGVNEFARMLDIDDSQMSQILNSKIPPSSTLLARVAEHFPEMRELVLAALIEKHTD
jgi:transcriptional regulator with XRE-family HTH domain